MPKNNINIEKTTKTVNRLSYIEPNYFASQYQASRQTGLNTTELSWNPEDLAMSVDLQVIIPKRSDKGQENYTTVINNINIRNSNINPIGSFVSYMGGENLSGRENGETYLTDNYTNISYQEISNGKVVDKESLGIDSIDINFDAHFFPLVTMHFTDIRGNSLFSPSEYEFYKSVTDGNVSKAAGSFFKALFHFPYPRFLLSVKGFYGNRVTFQLAVSDFRSEFQSETGNYGVTVKFIGYVYGLYTDIPLNLVMASPYYNKGYWEEGIKNGRFTYVSSKGTNGNKILTYVEFLSKLEGKDINSESLENAEFTKQYFRKSNKLDVINRLKKAHANLTTSQVTERNVALKAIGKDSYFIWGNYGYTNQVQHGGFMLNENAARDYYEAIHEYLDNFTDPSEEQFLTTGNYYIENILKKKKDNVNITLDDIRKDKTLGLLPYFVEVAGVAITEYFEFEEPVDGKEEYKIKEQKKGKFNDPELQKNGLFKVGSSIKASGTNYITGTINYGIMIPYNEYLTKLTNEAGKLENEIKADREKVAEELNVVYEEILGFAPTVENFYRMLFAHMDCFIDFFNNKICGEISDLTKKGERKISWFSAEGGGFSYSQLDLPMTKTGGNDKTAQGLDVEPFPAYYVENQDANGIRVIAQYPGESINNRFNSITEVKSVDKIISGVKLLGELFNDYLGDNSNPYGGNIIGKLSLLYNGKNPWDGLKIEKVNDSEDLNKILYFYLCQAVAEKYIGESVGWDNHLTNDFIDDQVDMLYKANLGFSETFKNTLNTVLAQGSSNILSGDFIQQRFGKTGKEVYHLLNFVSDTKDSKYLHLDDKVRYIPLVTDNSINLNTPIETIAKDDDKKVKYKLVNIEDNEDSVETTLSALDYFSVNGNMDIPTSSPEKNENFTLTNDNLKEMNGLLLESGKSSGIFKDVNKEGIVIERTEIPFGKFCVSLMEDTHLFGEERTYKYLNISGTWRWVWDTGGYKGINYRSKEYVKNYIVPYNTTGEFKESVYKKVDGCPDLTGFTFDSIELKEVNKTSLESIKEFYNNDTIDKYIFFVGRKEPDEQKKGNYKQDDDTAVNLFSGIKKKVNGNAELKCKFEEASGEIKYIVDYSLYGAPFKDSEFDKYLPLLYSRRCGGSNIEKDTNNSIATYTIENDDISIDDRKYAFATYFLATLCGYEGLKKIVSKFKTNIELYQGKKSLFEAVRKCDLLYLGGSLYFSENELNAFNLTKDGQLKKRVGELINRDGTLSYGLLKNDKGRKSEVIYEADSLLEGGENSIGYRLIEYFTEWCNNELFGISESSESMYDKLSKRFDEDNRDYMTLNGFAGRYNGTQYSEVQAYNKDSECSNWLTNLAYSYEHVLHLTKSESFDGKIYSDEIQRFLQALYNKIAEEDKKKELENQDTSQTEKEYNETIEQKRGIYYLLKNLYDKWLCSYTANEFKLKTPIEDLEFRKQRFCQKNIKGTSTEYNNFVYVDQYFNDISSMYVMDVDIIADVIKSIYSGKTNMDVYSFMNFMAQKNNLMLMALPVYTNMYNAESIASVFTPNTLYNMNSYDGSNGVGTTYVVMYTDQVSYRPSLYEGYEYNSDYLDIADLMQNQGPELKYFGQANNTNNKNGGEKLNYNVAAFGVSYSKQNQMYFKKVNVNMDNPKTTSEVIQNMLMLSQGGSQGDTNQPISVGRNIYSIYANRSYTCSVEMMGCANIMPLMYFQLNNIPMFRGLYMIINVEHHIKAGDMTTKFTGVRVSRYSMPDVNGIAMNSSIFDRLREGNIWKEGKDNYANCINDCPNNSRIASFKTKITSNEYMVEFVKTMKSLGWNKSTICGIGGACGAESGFKYWLVNVGEFKGEYPKSKANSTSSKPYVYGAGIIQWSLDRKKELVSNVTNQHGVKIYTLHGATSVDDFLITKVPTMTERKSISKSEADSKTKNWTGGIENFTMPEQAMCINYELNNNYKNVGDTLKTLTTDSIENVDNAVCTVYTKYVAGSSNTAGISTKEDACKVSCKYGGQFGETTGIEKRIAYAEWMYEHWNEISK